MKRNKRILIYGILGVFLFGIIIFSYLVLRSPWKFRENRPVKIFWINSYHSEKNVWTPNFIKGFMEIFEEEGLDVEIESFEMDTLSFTSEDYKKQIGEKTKQLIDKFNPDLIYATDDNAQEYVIKDYYTNSDIPVVFASVNKNPLEYGYLKSDNVAGVLEKEHIEGSFSFLKELVPTARKIVIISEPNNQWIEVLNKVEDYLEESLDFEVVARHSPSTFEEFQDNIVFYQDKTDAFFLTPISRFVDNQSNEVDSESAIRWLVENSKIPEITFWSGVIRQGFFAAVVVSYYEGGRRAGELAKEILVDGKKPSNIEFQIVDEGKKMINLARAENLGIEKRFIPSSILINSEVYDKFSWEDNEK